jgi:hypothetical protein
MFCTPAGHGISKHLTADLPQSSRCLNDAALFHFSQRVQQFQRIDFRDWSGPNLRENVCFKPG